jgi:hypothetical protein
MIRTKALALVVVLSVLSLVAGAGPAPAQQYYMGIGGNYALSSLSGKFDPGDSLGVNFRSGTVLREWFSAELNIDYLPAFKDEGTIELEGEAVDADFDLEVLTAIMDAKFTPAIGHSQLRPILMGGLGYMVTEGSSSGAAKTYLKDRSIDGSDFCGNVGLGFEYRASETYSFDLKGTYTKGFGKVSDVKILNFTLGVSFHF